MKKAILGSLAVLPLVVGSVFTNASSASAAALVGEFQFSSAFTTAKLSSSMVDFDDPGSDPGEVIVSLQTGSFLPFGAAFIKDIVPINSNAPSNNPFLDLEAAFSWDVNAVGDGLNVFNLTEVGAYQFSQSGMNVAIDLPVWGKFISADGKVSKGAGNLTFQVNNMKVADIQALIASGGMVQSSFSGAAFATVPEPASILGLGMVASSLALSRTRKKNQA
ncbi:MAG TPA: hypothetical protein DD379_26040 [Cyanobacteria bacterium UBA11162]|nr:hypothetical protein [Cyanobacteria bacterium UBA11162]